MTRFTVQTWCCEQWMTIDGAEELERHEAHALYHQEVQIAGQHRVRVVPVHE